jgi:uncharacterized repeat protein (TIGR01451 family)
MLMNKGRKVFLFFLLLFLPFVFGSEKNFAESQLQKGGESFERFRNSNRSGEVPICTEPHNQWYPAIYGDKIVWEDYRNGNWDIYMYDLTTGEERAICTEPHNQWGPAIYGDKIVWGDDRNGDWDIYMYDLTTGEERAICTEPHNQWGPAIYGDKIVWGDERSGYFDIYIYDLTTGQERAICKEHHYQGYPAIYGDKIVWEDYRNGNSDIYMYDLTTGQERAICKEPHDQWGPAIYGDKIVWTDNRNGKPDIYMYDLSTGQEKAICTEPHYQLSPAIYGDKIVWEDDRNGNWDIYMYDLTTGEERAICTEPAYQEFPGIYGDRIVWMDRRNGNSDIYMFQLSFTDTTSPAAPANLKAQAVSSSEMDLSWDASTDSGGSGLAGYAIERREAGGNFAEIARVDSNTTSFKDTGLTASTTYEYRVRAYDKAGNYSDYSNTVSVSTPLPKITLVKSVDKTSANIDDTLTYTLTYRNEGSGTIENVTIIDTLLGNLEYVSGSATGEGSFDSNSKTLTWKMATLNPGQEGSVSFKVKIVSGTEISNKATLSAPGYSIESNTVKTTVSSSLKLPWSFAIITDIHMGRGIYSSREEGGLKEIPLPNYLVDRLTKALENIKKLKEK